MYGNQVLFFMTNEECEYAFTCDSQETLATETKRSWESDLFEWDEQASAYDTEIAEDIQQLAP